jgi:hypothetical protein
MADDLSTAARIFRELATRLRSTPLDNNSPVLPATVSSLSTSTTQLSASQRVAKTISAQFFSQILGQQVAIERHK